MSNNTTQPPNDQPNAPTLGHGEVKPSVGKCEGCGVNFVGTPENPPSAGLCKSCEIKRLKELLIGEELAHWKAKQEVDRLQRELEAAKGQWIPLLHPATFLSTSSGR